MRKQLVVLSGLLAVLPAVLPAQAVPPWSGGRNDPVADRGVVFQVDDIDNVPDLHGDPSDAGLVLLIGGNQFMVLPELVQAFVREHPDLRDRIFYETLPPGILARQIAAHGTLTLGNLTLHLHPDVYEAGLNKLQAMASTHSVRDVTAYATNDLAIMVAAGNPKHIQGLADLGRADVRLSMPNPAWEGVAHQIETALRQAGGEELVTMVMTTKVRSGATLLTHIHHRETAMRILQGRSDAGVTWQSEVRFQQHIGNPIMGVAIPARQNTTGTYAAEVLSQAPHAAAAEAWVHFLQSPAAQAIYQAHGFGIPDKTGGGAVTHR